MFQSCRVAYIASSSKYVQSQYYRLPNHSTPLNDTRILSLSIVSKGRPVLRMIASFTDRGCRWLVARRRLDRRRIARRDHTGAPCSQGPGGTVADLLSYDRQHRTRHRTSDLQRKNEQVMFPLSHRRNRTRMSAFGCIASGRYPVAPAPPLSAIQYSGYTSPDTER